MKPVKGVNIKSSPQKIAVINNASPPLNGKTKTTIEASIDVGFGNVLFVRGQGAGLSWNKGQPLNCVDARTWKCSIDANEKVAFKLLLNDAVWAKGENIVAQPGEKLAVAPAF